jgi:hypothetical protein
MSVPVAVALRGALRPLADELDDGVLEFLGGELEGAGGSLESVAETLATFIPGYADAPTGERAAISRAVLKTLGKSSSSRGGGGGASSSSSSPGVRGATGSPAGAGSSSSGEEEDSGADSGEEEAGGSDGGEGVAGSAGGGVLGAPPPLSELAMLMAKVPPAAVASLRALFPALSPAAAAAALARTGGSNLELAAGYVLEHDVEAEVAAEEARQAERVAEAAAAARARAAAEARARAAALQRFDETPDDSGRRYAPTLPREMQKSFKKGEKVVKYLEGRPLFMRPTDKYYEEPRVDAAAAGGTSLKIKTKGQGGASPVFKK